MGMIKFHKTLAVPGTWDTDSLYFVKNGSYIVTGKQIGRAHV